mgnify:FL=1
MKNNTNLLISLLIILSCIIGIFNKSLFFDISINLFVIISFAILIIIECKKCIHNNITYHIIILTFIFLLFVLKIIKLDINNNIFTHF